MREFETVMMLYSLMLSKKNVKDFFMFTFVPAYEIDFQVGSIEFRSFPQHKFRKEKFSFSFVAFLNRKEGILSKKTQATYKKGKKSVKSI